MTNLRHAFASTHADSSDATLVRASNWNAKLQYTDSAGAPSGTDAIVREVLAANRTYYVRTDGSDSNTGLANTAGGAWLTLQHAYDTVCSSIDFGGYQVTVQIADGTYTAELAATQPWTGGGSLLFQGNTGAMSNVIIAPSSGNYCVSLLGFVLPGSFTLSYVKLDATNVFDAFITSAPGPVIGKNINFGACPSGAHINVAGNAAQIAMQTDYTISGSAQHHLYCSYPSALFIDGYTIGPITVTLSGTPDFTSAFAEAVTLAHIFSDSAVTWSGGATGVRYLASGNAVINTGGGGANYFPGDSAGSTATGAQYL